MSARKFLLLATLVLALAGVASASGQAPGPRVFATPEAAVDALVAALADGSDAALLDVFGQKHREMIVQKDQAAAREYRRRLHQAAQASRRLETQGDDRAMLIIGLQAWPFPVPLVREAAGWRFDTDAGAEEVINRRIGEHELSAIAVCRAYMDAQRQYASKDRDGDRVREYAQRLASTPGKQDGLYWDEATAPDREVSPFGPLVAAAQPFRVGAKPGDPYRGYYFKVLTAQGSRAPGGRYSYVINGNMIAGFAMIAYPADYGSSGVMTFMCSHHGTVFQKDLGSRTAAIGRAMREYDPERTWTEVGD